MCLGDVDPVAKIVFDYRLPVRPSWRCVVTLYAVQGFAWTNEIVKCPSLTLTSRTDVLQIKQAIT